MAWVAAAVAGTSLISGIMSSNAQADAADNAARMQSDSAAAGVAEQRRQFDSIQKLLQPYVQGGTNAFGAQQTLGGLNGNAALQQAINDIQNSPMYKSGLSAGTNSILQNASATGGLRGGNTQAALGQFAPQLLSQAINDQYARLGGLSSVGLGAATQTGSFGQQSANNVSSLLAQQGAAQAGGALAQGKANAQMWGAPAQALGMFSGMGGNFSGLGSFGGGSSMPDVGYGGFGTTQGFGAPAGADMNIGGAGWTNLLSGGF